MIFFLKIDFKYNTFDLVAVKSRNMSVVLYIIDFIIHGLDLKRNLYLVNVLFT